MEREGVDGCFWDRHEDARAWRPGNEIHESWWGRLVVKGIYWIGGFGDRAYIGWIPVTEWEGVTEEEVEKARLVGEEGYKAPYRGEYEKGRDMRRIIVIHRLISYMDWSDVTVGGGCYGC